MAAATEGGWVRGLEALPVLNLLDGIFTTWFVALGQATEANPLMGAALNASPVLFMVLKLALVNAGVLVLWLHRRARLVPVASTVALVAYLGVVAWHLLHSPRLL